MCCMHACMQWAAVMEETCFMYDSAISGHVGTAHNGRKVAFIGRVQRCIVLNNSIVIG